MGRASGPGNARLEAAALSCTPSLDGRAGTLVAGGGLSAAVCGRDGGVAPQCVGAVEGYVR